MKAFLKRRYAYPDTLKILFWKDTLSLPLLSSSSSTLPLEISIDLKNQDFVKETLKTLKFWELLTKPLSTKMSTSSYSQDVRAWLDENKVCTTSESLTLEAICYRIKKLLNLYKTFLFQNNEIMNELNYSLWYLYNIGLPGTFQIREFESTRLKLIPFLVDLLMGSLICKALYTLANYIQLTESQNCFEIQIPPLPSVSGSLPLAEKRIRIPCELLLKFFQSIDPNIIVAYERKIFPLPMMMVQLAGSFWIREKQYDVLNKILEELVNPTALPTLRQAVMGIGKSSVLIPILTCYCIMFNVKPYVFILQPSHLVQSAKERYYAVLSSFLFYSRCLETTHINESNYENFFSTYLIRKRRTIVFGMDCR